MHLCVSVCAPVCTDKRWETVLLFYSIIHYLVLQDRVFTEPCRVWFCFSQLGWKQSCVSTCLRSGVTSICGDTWLVMDARIWTPVLIPAKLSLQPWELLPKEAYFMCMGVWLHVYLCTMCMQCPRRPEESTGSPGAGVTGGCQMLCGCWESNWGSLKKRPVLLATTPKSCLFQHLTVSLIWSPSIVLF